MPRRVVCLPVATIFALPGAAQTPDEIIPKSIAVRGGEAKLRAVKSLRFNGHTEVAPVMTPPMSMVMKHSGMVRAEFIVQRMTGIQAYDGKAGWSVITYRGKKDQSQLLPTTSRTWRTKPISMAP
jgi:hypothetical protein